MSDVSLALGIELHLISREGGGRRSALAGGHGRDSFFKYRPNWGLPGMEPPDQSGAPVLGFDRVHIEPGEKTRAVIVPMFPQMLAHWTRVGVGQTLPMYEGVRVVGQGLVLWLGPVELPLPAENLAAFIEWLETGSEFPQI